MSETLATRLETRRRQERLPWFILVILLCITPCILCSCALWLPMHLNNLRLERFANGLYEFPLPPRTTVVDRASELDHPGNGNSCLYIARQEMVSTLSRGDIEAYYQGVMLPRVSFGRLWDERYDVPRVTPVDLEFDEDASTEEEQHFTVSLDDMGIDVTLDWRCH